MKSLIITNAKYNFLDKPWLNMDGIKEMVWEMYECFATDKTLDIVPMWEYFIEDENDFTKFYDEVMSYLAFDDFEHYYYLNDEKEIEKFYDMYSEHGSELDEDFITLFDQMRLFMCNGNNKYEHVPLIEVW